MHQIDRKFFLETSIHTLAAEVSELMHAGQLEGRQGLPKRFVIPYVGNGNPFVAVNVDRNGEDLLSVRYRQSLGCMEVIIFND